MEELLTRPSLFEQQAGKQTLTLFHKTELAPVNQIACFYDGRIVAPVLVSKALVTLANIVRSDFKPRYRGLPDISLLDPIVTTGQEKIRFEGFSSCNGLYARLDLLDSGLDGEFLASGTTNVNFNDPMISALNAVRSDETMMLSIGTKHVHIRTDKASVIEKKVALPTRWIKGLTSVQVYLASMREVFSLNKIQSNQLLQTIPKRKNNPSLYLSLRGKRPTISPIQTANAIHIGSIERLKLLNTLIPYIESMNVYEDEMGQSCALVLNCQHMRFTLALSPSCERGFSGEGNVLDKMLDDVPMDFIDNINELFKGNETFDPTQLTFRNADYFGQMEHLTASLASMGLLGFDLINNQYFYRRLPFKTSRILSLNPRLKNAKALVADSMITITRNEDNLIEAKVLGTHGSYLIVIDKGNPQCTCQWFTKHQTSRGLCKHILAVKMKTQQN